MAFYIKQQELIHRIHNGFLSHDGKINGELYDIYKDYNIDIEDPRNEKILNVILKIVDSMSDCGVTLYPANYRGSKIRDIRISKGISTGGLSRLTGISRSAICNIEKGRAKPKVETMRVIAQALNVDISDFI